MNPLIGALATAAALAGEPSPSAGAAPAIIVGPINPTTTLLITPTTGRAAIAIEANGLLLIPGHSPALVLPVNVRSGVDVLLVPGLR